ncbi:MAG TPA: cytochrome c oxidase assembly protein [Gaiellaceae bacterium]|nr:cytochrome c oxidase assembly protein [Gaiellaceae bacterium]
MAALFRASSWPVEWPLYAVLVAAYLYLLGGRLAASRPSAAKRWRGASFYAGLAAIALAVDSPVDAYADKLFWVHMLQHVLLMMVAPPLLLLGRPWPRIARPLPLGARRPVARSVLAGSTLASPRRLARWIASPLPSLVLFNGTLLMWHLPALYDLTLRNSLVHDLEHALFFTTALLLWTHLVPGATGRPKLAEGPRAAYATASLLVGWLLAIILAVAPEAVYGSYAALAHRPLGLSALGDQQLAAGIMWVPGSVPFTVAVFVAAYRWLDPNGASRRRRLGAAAADDLRPRET